MGTYRAITDPAEIAYYDSLYAEDDKCSEEEYAKKQEYGARFDGSYEASKGDWEGACLARAEYWDGSIS